MANGKHPFPPDIEQLLEQAEQLDSNWQDKLPYLEGMAWESRFFDWAAGKGLDDGRVALQELLAKLRSANR